MGYAVLHLDKASGNDAPMTAHIERTVDPKNVDKSRTYLNRNLIEFPGGVENRTQAIQHRIDNANITRKIGKNQVRAIRIMLSGTPEDMKRIEKSGKIDEWSNDNLDWLRKTFGTENLVSATLHLDEQTPHIHATVIPIVMGERRKARGVQKNDPNKKQYKKKNRNAPRLCADDVMSRDKLKEYQDTYAQAMQVYGLQRGIDGSEAKHITTAQYYRDLFEKKEVLQEHVDFLYQERVVVEEKVRDMYSQRDEIRNKFLTIDNHLEQKNKELSTIESKLKKADQDYEPYKAQDELNQIHELLPMVKEQLRIANFAQKMGLGVEYIKHMLRGVTLTINTAKLYSPEHEQKFEVKDSKIKIDKEPDNPEKLRLSLNGVNIIEWFREKYKELKESIQPSIQPNINKGKGFRR